MTRGEKSVKRCKIRAFSTAVPGFCPSVSRLPVARILYPLAAQHGDQAVAAGSRLAAGRRHRSRQLRCAETTARPRSD